MEDRTSRRQSPVVITDLPEASKDSPLNYAIFGLARIHRATASAMFADIGLYVGQEIMLMRLDTTQGQSQKALCDLLRVDHSTVAKSVSRLEKAGLVVRSKAEYDERISLVTLTQKGAELRAKVIEIWSSLEALTTADLTESERAQFIRLAEKIAANIENQTARKLHASGDQL
ncbi:MarR family winged helix-turn-helix transcriptional regulator [Mycobacteroides chelonae]|uniref:MarR family winged helix-turn-helix transcriptional regulator n=1 Tax=Mycobacteroides chelonae TaxID=1774 RepID=UPI0018E2993C|nr:MarR family winged helix-turn-helix transcriptional regulator [Mycobacteroides chelonae]